MPDSSHVPLRRSQADERRVRGLRDRLQRAGALPDSADPEASEFDHELETAVRAFQQSRGLIVDGVVGPETERRLSEAQYTLGDRPLHWEPEAPLRGDDVEQLQQNLSLLGLYYGHLNGSFEESTHHAVVELQQSLGLERSGRVDHGTIEALARINKSITSSKAFSLRDFHNLESANGAIRSRSIVLVPSALLPQHSGPAGAPEGFRSRALDISLEIARRAHEILTDVGAHPTVVSDRPLVSSNGTSLATAGSLEEALSGLKGPLVVVLGCDWNSSASASGVAAFYWGDSTAEESALSPIGQRGASLILRELVARTGGRDLGCHAREWAILRTTPAPTVVVDLGYLSNPLQAADLEGSAYQAHVSQAIVVGLQRMYLQTDDQTTGTLSAVDIAREVARTPRR